MRPYILFILSFLLNLVHSQTGYVEGIVKDKETDEYLVGANIIIMCTLWEWGAAADHNGYFIITNIPQGIYKVQASMIGYKPSTKEILISAEQKVNITFLLEETVISQPEVIVTAERIIEKTSVSAQTLNGIQLEKLHGAIEDPLRSLNTIPGVSSGQEFTTWLCVRGGAPNENLWLLDWVPVYWPFHFGGMKSAFNSEMIENLELYTGGFPAKFGNKLSSVVNITTREGSKDEFKGKALISLINALGLIQGPIIGKGSYIVSARRSYYDIVIRKQGFVIPSFYDVQAKIGYDLTHNQKIYINGLVSGERALVTFENPEPGQPRILQDHYLVSTSSAEWKWLVSSRLYSTLALTLQTADINFEMNQWWIDGKVYEPGLRHDLTWKMSNSQIIKTGFEIRSPRLDWKSFIPIDQFDDGAWTDTTLQGARRETKGNFWMGGLYLQDSWEIIPKFNTNFGLRYDYNTFNKKGTVSPRISARYELNVATALRSAFGYYYQLPELEEWVENPNIEAKIAKHYIIGLERIINPDIQGWIEFYQKDYSKLLVIDSSGHYSNDGFGFARGVEFSLQKKGSSFSGWISYALSWAKRKDYGDEGERWFEYDQRHILSLVFDYKFGKTWMLGMKWRYATGKPYTPTGSAPKSGRYPVFHRLDISLYKEFTWGNLRPAFYVELLNAYYRKNVVGYNLTYNEDGSQNIEPYYGIPIIPAIGFSLNF